MFVARISGLEGIRAGPYAQDDVEKMPQLHVVDTRAKVDAVAGVIADLLLRNSSERMIKRVHSPAGPLPAILHARVRMVNVVSGQRRVVDLQQEPGIDDGLIFLAHRLGDS